MDFQYQPCLSLIHIWTLYTQFTHAPLGNGLELLVHDLDLPAISRYTDGSHLVDVVHAQVDTARAGGLGQAIVGVVLVVGEVCLLYTSRCV